MFSKLGSLLFLVALTSARPKIAPTQATPKFAQELFAEPSNPLNPPNPDATWGSLSVCPVNKFARGFIQWQDINETNPHGLTKLAFRCMDYDKNPEWEVRCGMGSMQQRSTLPLDRIGPRDEQIHRVTSYGLPASPAICDRPPSDLWRSESGRSTN